MLDGLHFLFIAGAPIDKVIGLKTIEVLKFPPHYSMQ